jgi:hypothetical protein
VPVALNHLRRDRRGPESQLLAHARFDVRIQVREHADRARQLADADGVARAKHPVEAPLQLGVPERQLDAEGHRLGVNAVRASHHRRPAVLVGARPDRLHQPGDIPDDELARLPHLQGLRRIHHVGGREPEMQPPGRGPDLLGHRRRERDDVMLRGLLDLMYAWHVEARPRAQLAGGLDGNDVRLGHGVGRGQLDLEPRLVSALLAPDGTHLGAGIPRNHAA